MIPMTLHSPSYLFWKARYGTCQFFVYTLLLDDNFDSKYVLYLVRKVFSRRIQRRRLRGMGPSILWENWQLSDRPLSDQIKHIATFFVVAPLTGNDCDMFQGPKLVPIGGLDTKLISHLHCSISGYAFLYSGGAISWMSKQQSTTVTSSTHAEYITAAEAAKELVWLHCLLTKLCEIIPGLTPYT